MALISLVLCPQCTLDLSMRTLLLLVQVLSTFKGGDLEGCHYTHPLYERVSPLVLGGDYITTDSGTGLVHTAPGHGQEDYQVWCFAEGGVLGGD
jgi:isoleucyl-tRNA synthetase